MKMAYSASTVHVSKPLGNCHLRRDLYECVDSSNLSSFPTQLLNPILVSLWLQNGDFISGSNLYRRTFRTKMETNHNSVPQPVIHRIAQRTGTNVMELDFEVIDTDDDNVTVGILAYCGSDKLVPQAWLNGTGSKIGYPHRHQYRPYHGVGCKAGLAGQYGCHQVRNSLPGRQSR